MRGLLGYTERLESLRASAARHGVGHIHDSLTSLTDGAGRDHLVGQRIDRDKAISVLQSDIDPCSIPGRPDPMWQVADRNGRDFGKVVRAEHLNLVEPADRDIGKSA